MRSRVSKLRASEAPFRGVAAPGAAAAEMGVRVSCSAGRAVTWRASAGRVASVGPGAGIGRVREGFR